MRKVLKSKVTCKVHRASLDYQGSVTLPKALCDDLNIKAGEFVDINNKVNGNRISTYVIYGDSVQINGAAAHLFEDGDIVHINSYIWTKADQWPEPIIKDLTNATT